MEFFKVRVLNLRWGGGGGGGGGGGAGEFQILIPCRHILNFQHDTGTIYDMSGKAARKTQVTIKTFTETGNCT